MDLDPRIFFVIVIPDGDPGLAKTPQPVSGPTDSLPLVLNRYVAVPVIQRKKAGV
jgi:hypothetical protein